ncbi:2OG-Fe(II) oxygenase family protein [Sphingomonas sp. 1P06PA]|uniref:2OG-Fe(II) oxygenase n=1 Tax=Sphingomonas sp. 1P06PA TaxID=554121 RepID=UPI0039A58DE3
MPNPLKLNPALDGDALRDVYRRSGRIQIVNLLDESDARALLEDFASRRDWKLAINQGERVIDFSPEAYAKLGETGQAALSRDVIERGRRGFQFRYDTIRGSSDMPADHPLARVVALMNAPATLDLLRHVTDMPDIRSADGHASRYLPGHFLSMHDDRIAGRGRRAAYVLNLNPKWHPDWGGLLAFYDAQGQVARGFVPGWNRLSLFAVPQPHAVTWVTPLAPIPRIAVTGWLLGTDDG